MWTHCITSISHVLKLNGYGGRQAKVNEKSLCFKGWETLVINTIVVYHSVGQHASAAFYLHLHAAPFYFLN